MNNGFASVTYGLIFSLKIHKDRSQVYVGSAERQS